EQHRARVLRLADLVGEVAQRRALDRLHLGDHDVPGLVAIDHVGRPFAALALRLFSDFHELGAQLLRLTGPLVQEREGLAGGDGLNPAGPGADRALGEDHERADLGRRAHVRAAAELARVALDLDDAHLLAVLLPEEHHRAEVARLLDRRDERPYRMVLEDDAVDVLLDPFALLGRQRLGVREVEAQLVGAHGRARLPDMFAEHLTERLVHHVRRRVVGHRREPHRPRHHRAYARSLGEALALEGQRLVVLEPRGLNQLRTRAGFLVLDVAGVGDLAAALGVERRLLELRLEGAVAEVGVRKNRGQDVRALVADELAARPRHAHLDVEPGALPRALPLLLHEARELLFVHLEASLGSELLRQLPREAVRVVEPEPVFRRDLAL